MSISPHIRTILSHLHGLTAYDILIRLQDEQGLVYLHDDGHPVIAFLPQCYRIEQKIFQRQTDLSYLATVSEQPIVEWLSAMPQHGLASSFPTSTSTPTETHFQGGWIGFIGYDYAAQQMVNAPIAAQPAYYLGLYLSFLKFEDGNWIFYSTEAQGTALLQQLEKKRQQPSAKTFKFQLTKKCVANWEKKQYLQAFHQVIEYIRAGDCYQINLTQQFSGKAQGRLLESAQQFWQLTHAPYAGYLKIDEFELLSCSPELFIDFQCQHKIVTRPIKGTMPRSPIPEQDQHAKNVLAQSEKDQAENVMIVDLLRNDLSLYAETGSVKTKKLFEIESFEQVHHMVSEVEATLKQNIQPMHMLLTALPGGSITGAPKIRAMQLIAELEQQARGAYCGSLGYFNLDGTGRWNILIRSIQKYQHEISMWAGGGITIASQAEAEYQECFDKIQAILDLLNTWYVEPLA
ncbi:MAG: anthranilate synthase component I family protein [Acinetobacter sp.]